MRVIISFLFQVLSTVLIVGLGYSSLWLSFFYKLYIGHHIFIYFNKYTFPFIYLLLYKIYMVIIFLNILINVLLIKINYLYFNVFKRDFFIGLLRSNLGIFSIAKVWCFYIDLQGVVIWQHIHPSMLPQRRGLTRFQLPKILLRPENMECRNPSDILKWGPGAILIGNITLIASLTLARIGYPQVPIAGNHRLSLLVHHSSLHHHSLGAIQLKASFLLSRKYAPFRSESCWLPSLCLPTSVRWS